jgi:hypothetical protein
MSYILNGNEFDQMFINKFNEDSINKLNNIKSTIAKLDSYINNEITLSDAELRDHISILTNNSLQYFIGFPLDNKSYIARAVEYVDEHKQDFNYLKRHSYISGELIDKVKAGRANMSRESMLYACLATGLECVNATLSEVRAKTGRTYHVLLGEFLPPEITKEENSDEFSNSLVVLAIGFGDYIRKGIHLPWVITEKLNFTYRNFTERCNEHALLALQLCDAFICDLFKRDQSEALYKVTSGYVSALMSYSCDGVIYPSVQVDGYPNLALKPESVDKKIKFREVIKLEILKEHGYGFYEANALQRGRVHNGSIEWSPVNANDLAEGSEPYTSPIQLVYRRRT